MKFIIFLGYVVRGSTNLLYHMLGTFNSAVSENVAEISVSLFVSSVTQQLYSVNNFNDYYG